MRFARSSALVVALSVVAAEAADASWDAESYNPAPAPGDHILPMPCGGAMAFRRVNVPSGGTLDDHKITLGSHEEERGYAEYRRVTWLAGGFPGGPGAGERHYFIGKYEVTWMQQTALGDRCPDPQDPDGELPATGLSWAEAALFAERYSEWLVANGAQDVPTHEGAVGFLRLPTEAEWEFAARGGIAVSPAEFVANTFVPTGESVDAYAIHDGNSYRELNVIGTRQPNPLGIHDTLGNAAELVLAPFRLNVVSHLHGQAGGFVRRGGSYRTRREDIRTSHREEYPPVDHRGVRREKTTGFRLALVAPVLPSLDSVEKTRTAWRALQREPQTPTEPARAVPAQGSPVDEARRLAAAAPTERMKNRLEELAFAVAESIQARNQERQRAAREALSSAVFAARWVVNDRKTLRRWEPLLDRARNPERRERIRQNYENARRSAATNLNHYIDLLTAMAQDYGGPEIRGQRPIVEATYAARGQLKLRGLVLLVEHHVETVRTRGPEAPRSGIVESLERGL